MVSVPGLLGLAVIVVLHTAIAAVATRLLRVQLSSRWGPVVYAVVLVPVVLVFSTLVLSGVLGLGTNLGDPRTAVFVLIAIPLALGVTIDYVWMPAPDEVELPDTV
jgi:hypothetical protein